MLWLIGNNLRVQIISVFFNFFYNYVIFDLILIRLSGLRMLMLTFVYDENTVQLHAMFLSVITFGDSENL